MGALLVERALGVNAGARQRQRQHGAGHSLEGRPQRVDVR